MEKAHLTDKTINIECIENLLSMSLHLMSAFPYNCYSTHPALKIPFLVALLQLYML